MTRRPPAAAEAPSRNAPPSRLPWLRRTILPTLLLVGLTFAAFSPSLSGSFVWDDDAYITENPHLVGLSGLRAIWFDIGATKMYVPMVFSTFWIEHQLWGTRPFGYHFVNLCLHGLGAVLLWLVLGRLRLPGAWWAAALFAVHPIFVESVAWLTELKNTLSTVFCLLCLLAYFRFSPPAPSKGGEKGEARPRGAYLLSLLAFVAALLSKPVVVALPLVLLLLLWWRRGAPWRELGPDAVATAPMLLSSLGAGVLAMHVERLYGGAQGAVWEIPWLDRFLVAGRALWFYAGKLLWPVDLSPIYPRWEIDSSAPWQYLYPLAAVALVSGFWWFRDRLGRGPLVAVASFGLLLAPLVGFFNVSYFLNSYVADHFQHHAAPALLALISSIAATAALRIPTPRLLAPCLAAGLLAVLAAASHRYAPAFANEEIRCRTVLDRNPDSWLAMNNLGVALNRKQAFEEARGWFEKAIRTRSPYPEAESNLGVALVGLGRPQEAIGHYRESIRIWPENPLAHNNLGTALAQVGKIDEARAAYGEALRLRPGYAAARENIAKLHFADPPPGTSMPSPEDLRKAVEANPASADHHAALGSALNDPEECLESVRELSAAVHLRPEDAEIRHSLAMRHASCGDLENTIVQFRAVAGLRPDSVVARINLASALSWAGRIGEALPSLEEALRLDPQSASVHVLLGASLAQRGRLSEAETHFSEALRLDPADAEARQGLQEVRALLAGR